MELKINNQKVYFYQEEARKHELFLEYRELLLYMVGFSASDETVKAANEHIYENCEKYREFITL